MFNFILQWNIKKVILHILLNITTILILLLLYNHIAIKTFLAKLCRPTNKQSKPGAFIINNNNNNNLNHKQQQQ